MTRRRAAPRPSSLFTDPGSLHALHPEIGALMDTGADCLRRAYNKDGTPAEDCEHMLHGAESNTLRANALLVTVLGPHVDAYTLLPLVRLAVESIAAQSTGDYLEALRRRRISEERSARTTKEATHE